MRNLLRRIPIFLLLMAALNYFSMDDAWPWPIWCLVMAVVLLAALAKEAVGALLAKGLGRPVNEPLLFILYWLLIGLLVSVVTLLGAKSGLLLLPTQWALIRSKVATLVGVFVCLELLVMIGAALANKIRHGGRHKN